MRALIIKEFRELGRDRRTVAMLIALPIALLIIFGYAANFSVEKVEAQVIGPGAEQLAQRVETASDGRAEVTFVDSSRDPGEARDILRDSSAKLVIYLDEEGEERAGMPAIAAHVDGSALFSAQAVTRMVGAVADVTVEFNPDLTTSWVMIPGLIALILNFIGVLITSIGLVRERESGTLEQLAVMPLRPSAIILGKIAPYFLLALIDVLIITIIAVNLFSVPFRGGKLEFALAAMIFLFAVLGIGTLISTASSNAAQAIQLSIMAIMPQILLSGLIFPLESMAAPVRWLAYCFPLTWFYQISLGIMLRGAALISLWKPLLILTAMALLIFTAATARMRHALRTGGGRRA